MTLKTQQNKTPPHIRTLITNVWENWTQKNKTPVARPIEKTKEKVKTPTPNKMKQMTKPTQKTKMKVKTPVALNKTKKKEKTPSPKTTTKRKTPTNNKFANHPDYEYDTMKKRWVKKSDLRPVDLVNRYKIFLIDYLKINTDMDHKKIEKLVRKHATSTNRLKEILVEEGEMTQRQADRFFIRNSFWKKELCKHMKKICPTERDINEKEWCDYSEDAFCYFKDQKNKISCYSINDIYNIISSSFTGGDDDTIFLQLPKDPYTRKVFTQEFIKTFLKQLRLGKERLNNLHVPHVLYFLRNYKKFYSDPNIKTFLKKKILTNREKWELSEAIEEFLTEKDVIHHGFTTEDKRSWFWNDDKKEPKNLYDYIFKK